MKPRANVILHGAITLNLLSAPNPDRWKQTIDQLKAHRGSVPQIVLFSSRKTCEALRTMGLAAPSNVYLRGDTLEMDWIHPHGYLLITICQDHRSFTDAQIHPGLD